MLREKTAVKDIRELPAKTLRAGVTESRKFIDGDHWQEGVGWVGPKPRQGEDGFAETMQVLQDGFVSANRIEEVSDRHASGVVGREPQFGLVPLEPLGEGEELDDATKGEIDELEAAITKWWNENGVHEKLYDAVMNVAWGGRSVFRLYVPTGLRDVPVQGERTVSTFLGRVFVDAIAPESGTVHHDPETMRPLGVVLYKDEKDVEVMELSYTDEAGKTYVEVVRGENVAKSEPLELGGRITMHEMSRRPIVSEQMRSQQKAHNLALSMLPRNIVTGGFLERVLINAQQPGEWELDPETKAPIRFRPKRLMFGSGTVTWVTGIETTDEATGKTATATPDVKYREPISPDPTIAAQRATYASILEEAQQAHVLMNSEANASGRSRVEARKDYEGSLRLTKPAVERAGRWLIETALALAGTLMGGSATNVLEKYRVDFTCRLDTGAITPEERRQNDESVKAGTMPKEYAIAAIIDDVDAALALINSQTGVLMDEMKARAEVVKLLADAGASLDAAAEVAGMDEEAVKVLRAGMVFGDPEGRGGEEDDEEDGGDPADEG